MKKQSSHKEDYKPVEKVLLHGYQHISNGGMTFEFVRTETKNGRPVQYELDVQLSSFGVTHRSIIPVFSTTPAILRAIADEMERQQVADPLYLSNTYAYISSQFLGEVYYRAFPDGVQAVDRTEIFGGEAQSDSD
jgi:hypothetical protein